MKTKAVVAEMLEGSIVVVDVFEDEVVDVDVLGDCVVELWSLTCRGRGG